MIRYDRVWLPEGFRQRVVKGTETELKQGRIICSYQGKDKASGKATGIKYKVEMAPPPEWKDCQYLSLGTPRLITQREHRREIQVRRWLPKQRKWANTTRTISYRVGSKTLFWWT